MKYEIPVNIYRELPDPFGRDNKKTVYIYVNIKSLPEELSLGPNPREQNMKTLVAKKIVASLQSGEECFHLLNRGLVIHAKDIRYNPAKSMAILEIPDNDDAYGILDGGHSYRAILDNRNSLKDDQTEFVKLEIIVGADENFEKLAASRNTSVQVTDSTIAELEKRFDFVKEKIRNEPYFNNIAFKQNEQNKDIEIVDLVKIMYAFNLKKFPDHNHVGVSAYTSSKAVMNDFLLDVKNSKESEYEKISEVLPDIIELYDLIEADAGVKYKEGTQQKGKYGAIKGIDGTEGDKKYQSKFYKKDIDFRTPLGFIFPILASFKALLEKDELGKYQWIYDPKKAWEENGAQLMITTIERSTSLGSNPQSTGKDAGLWKQNLSFNLITALTRKAK